MELEVLYGVSGADPGSAVCKASTLSAILSPVLEGCFKYHEFMMGIHVSIVYFH